MIDPSLLATSVVLWFTDTTTPVPVPGFDGDVNLVTPGVVGFAVTFLIAAVTVLLIMDMVRRVRRVRYRAEVRERLEAERLEASGADAAAGASTTPEG